MYNYMILSIILFSWVAISYVILEIKKSISLSLVCLIIFILFYSGMFFFFEENINNIINNNFGIFVSISVSFLCCLFIIAYSIVRTYKNK